MATADIYQKIDQMKACIHCGMCLPACPTYLETANEGNSPRGRLYLIKDLLDDQKAGKIYDLDNKAIEYLDNCLYCKACETACPSGVEYGSILDYARTERKQNHYNHGFLALVRRFAFRNVLPNREALNFLRKALELVNQVYKFLPFLPKLSKLQPRFEEKYQEIQLGKVYRSQVREQDRCEQVSKTISMPLGCVMDTVYNHVHLDTIKVLNAFGYDVYIPETKCCGALAHHSGEAELGHIQLKETISVLKQDAKIIVFNSAGCGSFVKDHSDLETLDFIEALEQAPYKPKFVSIEISSSDNSGADLDSLRSKQATNDNLDLKKTKPEKIIASYHPACHLNHAQGIKDEYIDLLKQIPNLELVPLEEADVCCGSAGFYNLIKDKMASQIGKRKAGFIQETNAHLVITANPGCMSQIQAYLPDNYTVMHPATLLARAIN